MNFQKFNWHDDYWKKHIDVLVSARTNKTWEYFNKDYLVVDVDRRSDAMFVVEVLRPIAPGVELAGDNFWGSWKLYARTFTGQMVPAENLDEIREIAEMITEMLDFARIQKQSKVKQAMRSLSAQPLAEFKAKLRQLSEGEIQ